MGNLKSIPYWKTLLKQNKLPCLVADYHSKEVLYVSDEMEKLAGTREDLIGKKYYEVIRNDLGTEHPPLSGEIGEILSRKIFDQKLNKEFVVTLTLGEYEGKKYIFSKYASGQNLDNPNFDFEVAMSRCITALHETDGDKNKMLLQILGEFFDAEKTYLFQINKKDMKIPCLAYWTKNEKVAVTHDLGNKLDVRELMEWFDTRNEVGMIEISRSSPNFQENSLEARILDKLNLRNIMLGLLEDENRQALGLVLVSNRDNMVEDFRLIHGVARFLENELTTIDAEGDVDHISKLDVLTGFYSRMVYAQRVDEMQLNPPSSLGIVAVNVNGLRKVNTQYGYAKGDEYLKKSASILQEHFDSMFYRISGDEFISFFPEVDKDSLDVKVTALQEKMRSEKNHIFALGHAWADGRLDINKMIREADTIVKINKQEYYHDTEQNFKEMKDSLLSDLLSHLLDKEFMIYLQPQVKLEDGSIYGAEALIRRFDKSLGRMVYPDQFVPLYEQRSIIRHVDVFVIEEVCRLLESFQLQGTPIPISVNLSRVTLQEYGIVDTIAKICDRFNVAHDLLILEVTERVGLIENNVPTALVEDFKRHGFKISLDDFGCAYSNIITLAQIEVDEVKLDKSLVDNLTTNVKNLILVRNILRMCNELKDTSVLAEGIEGETQAKFLQQLGCHYGQGYYYSKPMDVEDFCEKYMQKPISKK